MLELEAELRSLTKGGGEAAEESGTGELQTEEAEAADGAEDGADKSQEVNLDQLARLKALTESVFGAKHAQRRCGKEPGMQSSESPGRNMPTPSRRWRCRRRRKSRGGTGRTTGSHREREQQQAEPRAGIPRACHIVPHAQGSMSLAQTLLYLGY